MKTTRYHPLLLASWLTCHGQTLDGDEDLSFLQKARALDAPVPNSTIEAEDENFEFWEQHSDLIEQAWNEWYQQKKNQQPILPQLEPLQDLINPPLREAMDAAWDAAWDAAVSAAVADTSSSSSCFFSDDKNEDAAVAALQQYEERLASMWKPVAPGVYSCQFLDPRRLSHIERHLKLAEEESQIPTRRPNGMNRYGLILEPSIPGAVAMPSLNDLYEFLVQNYVRPLGRILFSEYIGRDQEDDVESYAFTINYKADKDLSLAEHSDASLFTLNINLNPPPVDDEDGNETSSSALYEGSDIYFAVDEEEDDDDDDETSGTATTTTPRRRRYYNVSFAPGMALLHRGMIRHAAQPITKGERTNLVVWVYGRHGYVRIVPYAPEEQASMLQRWTTTTTSLGVQKEESPQLEQPLWTVNKDDPPPTPPQEPRNDLTTGSSCCDSEF